LAGAYGTYFLGFFRLCIDMHPPPGHHRGQSALPGPVRRSAPTAMRHARGPVRRRPSRVPEMCMTTDVESGFHPPGRALRRRRIAVIASTVLALVAGAVAFASASGAAPTLISQGKPAVASSTENA